MMWNFQSYPTTVLNERMKELIFLGVKTYSDPYYVFSGGSRPQPFMIYASGAMHNWTSCRRAAATVCPVPSAAEQTATWQQFPTANTANTFSRPPLQPPDAPTRRWAKLTSLWLLLVTAWWHLTLKVVSESRVTWTTSNFGLLGLPVLDLGGQMYATDRQTSDRRQTSVRQKHRLMPPPPIMGGA